jgi:hypothetical protein
MANNRDLLKEAIADAKAVKETAIANAKAALEESFGPFLREKLSQKISEMEETEEEMMTYENQEMEMKKEEMDEVSLDELLAELEDSEVEEELYEAKKEEKEEKEEEEEMSIEDMSEDDLKSFIESVIQDMVSAGELEAGHEGMENEEGAEEDSMDMDSEEDSMDMDSEKDSIDMDSEEEEVNLDELLAELEGELEGEVKENSYSKETAKKTVKETDHKELEEAYSTIKTLKSELNEINVLNAKLLYTNKIFRTKSLTESQKIKVLTAFDKATTKKEVELIYETLQEGLKAPIATKSPIRESLSSASKALGSAAAKPIIENDAFSRMRELAFGKK